MFILQLPEVDGSFVQLGEKLQHKARELILQKCGKVQIFRNNTNKLAYSEEKKICFPMSYTSSEL